ncbi:MAG: hypothetical protein ABIR59_01140 [Gemmatimonadales bacterium]
MHHRDRDRLFALLATTALAGCTPGRSASAGSAERAQDIGLTELSTAPAVQRVFKAVEMECCFTARPAPDGRSITMSAIPTGDLRLYDLMTSTVQALRFKSPDDSPGGHAESSAISPDGKSIAYGWYNARVKHWEIRVGGLAGPDSGTARTLLSPPDLGYSEVLTWMPDGNHIVARLMRRQDTSGIAAVSVTDGSTRMLKARVTTSASYPMNVSVSRDGQWLAYDDRSPSGDRDVYVMATDRTQDNLVVQHKGDDVVMGWAKEDGRLLVGTEHGSTPSVWSVSIKDGKASGEPVLVRSNLWGNVPVGTSANGNLFFSVIKGDRNVYTVGLDPRSAVVISTPMAMGGESLTSPYAFDWSADGEHLALVTKPAGGAKNAEYNQVLIRSLKGEQVRRLSPKLSSILQVQWYPDGRALLLYALNPVRQVGMYRMDVKTAELSLVTGMSGARMRLSPDGTRLVILQSDSGGVNINEKDPVKGNTSKLSRVENAGSYVGYAFSPDGRTLAVAVQADVAGSSRIVLVPLGGGAQRVLLKLSATERLSFAGIAWSGDGKHLLYSVESPFGKDQHEVRTFSMADGSVVATGLTGRGLRGLVISRDGRTLTYGVDDLEAEFWMMHAPVTTLAARKSTRP